MNLNLTIKRTYYPGGTNSIVTNDATGVEVCKTIELPWLNNQRRVSCIPEGRYRLVARFTASKGKHFAVLNVPGRDAILFHAANDAQAELLGCFAPVVQLAGQGKGYSSRLALSRLVALAYPILNAGGEVWITVTK